MTPPAPYLPAAPPALSQADQEALTDLYVRGTPANTLRAYERDLLYITAWKSARFAATLDWPESEATALAFILDHARDLSDAAPDDRARQTAEALIAQGLRKSLACPAPSTLDRRIASWLAFDSRKSWPTWARASSIATSSHSKRSAMAATLVTSSTASSTGDMFGRGALDMVGESCTTCTSGPQLEPGR